MTQNEFIRYFTAKGFVYQNGELVGPEQTGAKTGRQIQSIYTLGKFGAKTCIEYQDTKERTALKNCADYSQLEVLDGKLARKAPEVPKEEVIESKTEKEVRKCKVCKGSGLSSFVFEGKQSKCSSCHGEPDYYAPDFSVLIPKIMGRKGLKTTNPARWPYHFKSSARLYLVWRLARFDSGVDVTAPVNSVLAANGDPFYNELEQAASYVAKKLYGTNLAGAYRWANALGSSVSVPDGLPMTAYSCGPVVIGPKPECEALEL